MLVTQPAGKGPQGRVRTGEQSRTECSCSAKLGSVGMFVQFAHCSVYLCISVPAFALLCVSAPTFVWTCACGTFSLQMCVHLGTSCVLP